MKMWSALALLCLLTCSTGAAERQPGYLVANTQPWAKVLIDGNDTGKFTPVPPSEKIPLSPGKHILTFIAAGHWHSYTIDVRSGEDLRVIKALGPTP